MDESDRDRLARVARLGYAARGVVFLLVAGLAARSAVLQFSQVQGARDALRVLGPDLYGRAILGILALGMMGYVAWRFTQAVTLPLDSGRILAGALRRVAYGASGLAYAMLAFTAAELAVGAPSSGDTTEEWTAWLLQVPFGSTVLLLIGAGLTGGGGQTIYRGLFLRFMRVYDTGEIPPSSLRVLRVFGAVGLTSVGMALAAAGGYVIVAALREDATRIVDLGGVLEIVAAGTHGPFLLALAAAGIGAYAVHCFLLGRYRRIGVE